MPLLPKEEYTKEALDAMREAMASDVLPKDFPVEAKKESKNNEDKK